MNHKHENLTEIHTLMAAPIKVSTLTKSAKQGFEYPVSGDTLAILHTAIEVGDRLLASQIIGERCTKRIEHENV